MAAKDLLENIHRNYYLCFIYNRHDLSRVLLFIFVTIPLSLHLLGLQIKVQRWYFSGFGSRRHSTNLGMQSVHDIFVWPKKLSHDHIRQSNNKSMHVDAKLHIIARVHNWGFFWNDGPWMHHCQWTAAFDMTTKQSNMQTLVILKKKGSQFTCKGTLLVQPQYECRWTVSKKGEQKLEGKMHQQKKNLPQHEFLEAWLVNYFENVS